MDLFDIIGPVMVGPSSSHTAGAARIGRVTRGLLGAAPVRAEIGFHGSFSKTWRGHGTDRAVVGGLLDMGVDDIRIRESLSLAQAAGMEILFSLVQLRAAHPNTVVISAWDQANRHVSVQGASIGGGNIIIQSLNGLEVGFTGKENTLVIQHTDAPGVIAHVSGLLAQCELNIATMRVFRKDAGAEAIMAIELDSAPEKSLVQQLELIPAIQQVTFLEKGMG